MAIDLVVLKTEIETDPTSRGYALHVTSGATNVIADLLNEVLTSITIQRETLMPPEVWEAVDLTEFKVLSGQERQALGILLSLEPLDVRAGSNSRTTLASLFPGGSTTRTNLLALVMRNGSRSEELFGENVIVRSEDITLARGGP